MTDGKDPDLGASDIVDDPIVPCTKFAVPFETPSKRLAITDRIREKPLFDRLTDPFLDVPIDEREIFFWDIRMVGELIRHVGLSGLFPNLFVGKTTAWKGLFPILRLLFPVEIFFNLHCLPKEVSGLQGHRDTLLLRKAGEGVVEGFF